MSQKRPRTEEKPAEFYTNTIRCLAIDVVQGANSGHPGAPMGMAPASHILWSEFLKFDPANPDWDDRDRFVLSNGHASALIYTMLHLTGYKLPIEQLKRFRQLGSITPGHPERHVTPGVEVTTGPLGQGLANAVGLAIAEAHLAATFNKPGHTVVDHYTWVFCGDGCLMEGIGQEAMSLAGHLGLEKLIVVYDDNKISIDGSTDLAYTEDKANKYRALNFHVIEIENGNTDHDAIRVAFTEAKAVRGKPKMILLKTIIGFGAKLENTAKVHGAPLGAEDIKTVKAKFGMDPEKQYHVDPAAYAKYAEAAERGAAERKAWLGRLADYKKAFAAEGKKYDSFVQRTFPAGWESKLPKNDKPVATRKASENALAEILPLIGQVVGGSADLTGSNLTRPGSAALVDFQKATPEGRYIRFGVREHAMCGITNGIDAHGGLIAFSGTFLNFIGYALGSVRLSAMSEHAAIYVATHDSIGLGEDGPTHQPVELVASLRATPNLYTFRPADQNETSGAWAVALKAAKTPSVLCLTRQATPPLANSSIENVAKGGYTAVPVDKPEVVLIGTGSEVGLCVDAAKLMTGVRVAVVSMPCTALFDAQSAEYKAQVLPPGVPIVSVEVYSPVGWEKYSHYHVGMRTFGGSAPAEELYKHFGFTPEKVAETAKKVMDKFKGTKAPQKGIELL